MTIVRLFNSSLVKEAIPTGVSSNPIISHSKRIFRSTRISDFHSATSVRTTCGD